MKTEFHGKQWILETLLNGGVKDIISGSVYKDKRPSGSTKEDIVINGIVMDNNFYQDGVFNVNVYVPYLSVTIGGVSQYVRNHTREMALGVAIYPLLHDIWGNGFNMTVVNHRTFEEDNEKAAYINFRINLKTYN